MSERLEKGLPITRPSDLSRTGHVLLREPGNMLHKMFFALYQKKYRREVEIGLFDFTSKQSLVNASESITDDDDYASIEYVVTDAETARRALEEFNLAFEYRRKTPSAPGTWVLFVDGLAATNWELFRLYLREGKQARIYVVAALENAATPWLPEGLFDTVID